MAQHQQATRRGLIEEANRAALEARWDDAIALNQAILEHPQKDAEAYNRLGRAYLALQRYDEAAEAYREALRVDPANLIARRNLQRLDLLRHRPTPAPDVVTAETDASPMPRPTVFIEEVGKTWVDELINPAEAGLLAEVLPGEQLTLERDGDRLLVKRRDGALLGEIEEVTASRVLDLSERGNRYEAYALGLSGQSLRVILRESYHDQALGNTVSFPRQITSRAYLRERDLLRQRDESDFLFLEDDEEDDVDESAASEADEEEGNDTDEVGGLDETLPNVDDEESQI
ncbi:MAG TPA: tetratricopeptide repeat protein [Thermomicrobiales bacterium]|nr:tetratricopeptide repeat protein [Thermomicrobiales bacterium]